MAGTLFPAFGLDRLQGGNQLLGGRPVAKDFPCPRTRGGYGPLDKILAVASAFLKAAIAELTSYRVQPVTSLATRKSELGVAQA